MNITMEDKKRYSAEQIVRAIQQADGQVPLSGVTRSIWSCLGGVGRWQ
jgi:hypothetical protein